MSWQHDKLAWKVNMPSSRKIVLLVLCHLADEHGFSFPSVDTIAKRAGVKRRQCQRLLRELEHEGLVSVVGNASGGARSRDYRVDLLALRKRAADDTGVKLSPVSCVTPLPVSPKRRPPVVGVTRTTSHTHQPDPPLPDEPAIAAIDWSFLPQLDEEQRSVVVRLLNGVDQASHQDLVDELAGALRASAIRGPWGGWFAAVAAKARTGGFTPHHALAVRKERGTRAHLEVEQRARRLELLRWQDPEVKAKGQAAMQAAIADITSLFARGDK